MTRVLLTVLLLLTYFQQLYAKEQRNSRAVLAGHTRSREMQAAFQAPAWQHFVPRDDQNAEAWAVIVSWTLEDVAIQSALAPDKRRIFEFEGEAVQYAVSNTLKYFPRGEVGIRIVDTTVNMTLTFEDNAALAKVRLLAVG